VRSKSVPGRDFVVHTSSCHSRTQRVISAIDVDQDGVAVFVHGVGIGALLWRNVIEQLESERRCIAIDLVPHGRTPARPDQSVSLSALAELIEQVCAAFELKHIDLVANDTGGGDRSDLRRAACGSPRHLHPHGLRDARQRAIRAAQIERVNGAWQHVEKSASLPMGPARRSDTSAARPCVAAPPATGR
jgi:alpha/beta hydrolase fold